MITKRKKGSGWTRIALSAGMALIVAAGVMPVQAAEAAGKESLQAAVPTGAASIQAEIDGRPAQWGDSVYTYRSLTYVPVREGAVSLGARVKWDKAQRAAIVTLNGDELLYRPDSETVSVNGYELKMPGTTRYVGGILTVPLRGLTEPLRASVNPVSSGGVLNLSLKTDAATVFDAKLEAVNAYLKEKEYSGSVLIAQDGKVLMRKAYGLSTDTTTVRPTDQMRLGSLTKAFTAASILKLEEEGKLSTDDTLARHIPDYPRGDEIKLSMLLSHTSGIALNFVRKEGTPLSETVEEIKKSPLKFAPGTDYMYSNSGYVLLAYIIEQTSGMSYADFVQTRILDPLGMKHSGTATRQTKTPTGYEYDWQTAAWNPVGYYFSPSGTGSLYSTLDDMLIWSQALSAGKVLSEETMERMYTTSPYKNYGYGWHVDGQGSDRVAFHSGGGDGYTTGIRRGLNDGTVIILLSNHGGLDTNAMTAKIRELAFGQ
ncbi:serine hydrolase [Saccharibacillus alkalitolerans]|uniref:Serine hydrolase n=1 Tax=Saccharibacillus alkalitolerans TaxID=2705290 RepID=A0ABX0F3E1_9BACL|nr:serine hydrolase [Saccharibacillus alkalitolerans]NGZ74129.1 serine hydrolase [Saccharibacillus alkalitolerans]